MKDYNKQNLILLGIILAVGLTLFSTFILVDCSTAKWAAPLPVVAVGYAVYSFIKKYFPLTHK